MAQENIHSVRKKKGKVGFIAIKVDSEKAYERLRWDFIHDTLTEFAYPLILFGLPWSVSL